MYYQELGIKSMINNFNNLDSTGFRKGSQASILLLQDMQWKNFNPQKINTRMIIFIFEKWEECRVCRMYSKSEKLEMSESKYWLARNYRSAEIEIHVFSSLLTTLFKILSQSGRKTFPSFFIWSQKRFGLPGQIIS